MLDGGSGVLKAVTLGDADNVFVNAAANDLAGGPRTGAFGSRDNGDWPALAAANTGRPMLGRDSRC